MTVHIEKRCLCFCACWKGGVGLPSSFRVSGWGLASVRSAFFGLASRSGLLHTFHPSRSERIMPPAAAADSAASAPAARTRFSLVAAVGSSPAYFKTAGNSPVVKALKFLGWVDNGDETKQAPRHEVAGALLSLSREPLAADLSPVREVGTSSCWAPPPSRQPQCGSEAPYHGRLGAIPRWGDNVRVEGPANGRPLDRI